MILQFFSPKNRFVLEKRFPGNLVFYWANLNYNRVPMNDGYNTLSFSSKDEIINYGNGPYTSQIECPMIFYSTLTAFIFALFHGLLFKCKIKKIKKLDIPE